jgi:hypothetical protein
MGNLVTNAINVDTSAKHGGVGANFCIGHNGHVLILSMH